MRIDIDALITGSVRMRGWKRTTDLGVVDPCPAKEGCDFIGRYNDIDGDCWCVYWCPLPIPGLVFEACP